MSDLSLNQVIELPQATATQLSLVFADGITDDELAEIGTRLLRVESCREWWIGDYGAELKKRKDLWYACERAEVFGVASAKMAAMIQVAEFYPPSVRLAGLTHAHHVAAMLGGNEKKHAGEWLAQAKSEGLTVSQLRKAINTAHAEFAPDQTAPERSETKRLDDADNWLMRNKTGILQKLTPGEAEFFLNVRFATMVEFVDGLRQIAQVKA